MHLLCIFYFGLISGCIYVCIYLFACFTVTVKRKQNHAGKKERKKLCKLDSKSWSPHKNHGSISRTLISKLIQTTVNFIIFIVTVIMNTFLRKHNLSCLFWWAATAIETELANGHSLILKHNIGNSCIFMNRAISETSEHVCLTFALWSLEICWLKVPSKLGDSFWYCHVTPKNWIKSPTRNSCPQSKSETFSANVTF